MRPISFISVALLLLGPSLAAAQPFEERYRERVALFERENRQLAGDAQSVVLFGSSSMEGWRYSNRVRRYLPNLQSRVLNRGISGDGIGIKATTGLYNRVRVSVGDAKPTHVFVLNGRNSLGYGADRVAARYRDVIKEVKRLAPDAVVTIVSCAPVRGSYAHMKQGVLDLNAQLRVIAREEGAFFYDLHSLLVDGQGLMKSSLTNDGLHFKDEGYRLLGAEIERIVRSGARPPQPTPPAPAPAPDPAPEPDPAPASSETREVAVAGLNLRSGPGRNHPRIATLSRGTRLDVLEREGDWIRVKTPSGREGWLYRAFTDEVPAPSQESAYRVTATRLNVRAAPGLDGRRLGTFAQGAEVTVLARQGEWWRVRSGSREGWVHSRYLAPKRGIVDRLRSGQ